VVIPYSRFGKTQPLHLKKVKNYWFWFLNMGLVMLSRKVGKELLLLAA